jgi:hypothetical protein
MALNHTQQETIVGNAWMQVRASLEGADRRLQLAVCAVQGGGAVPILRREGGNAIGDGWRVEAPERCSLEVVEAGDVSSLVISGMVEGAGYHIHVRVGQGDPWIEISEVLCLDRLAPEARVEWFEAVWRFADWREPGEVFSPLLAPQPGDVIGRHVMRAPALTAQCGGRAAAMIYDIDAVRRQQALPACMNLLRDGETRAPVFRIGLQPHQARGHVYFTRVSAPARQARFHFTYLAHVDAASEPGAAIAAASRRLWSGYGARSLKGAPDLPLPHGEYARQIYPRVFEQRWAETELGGRRAGAVRINRSYPNDVWMCPWFSQARSAYGLYLWGKWLEDADWQARAVATRDLHLAAPQERGLFPTVFVFGPDGGGHRWVHSHHQGGGPGLYHLADMSWTVYQLLRWHRDLIPDARTIAFARRYADGVLALQRADGGLPAYVDSATFKPVTRVDTAALLADLEAHPGGDGYVPHMLRSHWPEGRFEQTAEDAGTLLMLAELARVLPVGDADRERYLRSAAGVADWLERWAYPDARWIDFEVHFSCSVKPLDFYDHRSGQWPQNTLCMHQAAAGMLVLHELTGDRRYLNLAERAMDRLTLYQQVWDPPFLNVYGFGGYGVMNTDGEWSDARQAQFADTHLDFYRVTGRPEHLERARAACQASFVTLYLPANSRIYPTGWPEKPMGIAAENHGHGGTDHLCGVSGFDWGSGSALATAAYLRMHNAF